MSEETTSEIIEHEPNKAFLELIKKDPEKSHSYLHMTWAKILSGVKTKWTLEDLYRLHKVVLGIMITEGIKHISNIDTLDTTETLRQIETLKQNPAPKEKFTKLMQKNIEEAHSLLHKSWNMILSGKQINWTLEEIYKYHKMILGELRYKGKKHISNVDTLDTTETLSDINYKNPYSTNNNVPISLNKILKHLFKSQITEPIAYLIDTENSSELNILINKHDDIIKEKISEMLPEEYKEKINYVDQELDETKLIPFLELDDILKSKIFDSFMTLKKEEKKKIPPNLNKTMKKIYEMTIAKASRQDISNEVNLAKSTVYLKQKELKLI